MKLYKFWCQVRSATGLNELILGLCCGSIWVALNSLLGCSGGHAAKVLMARPVAIIDTIVPVAIRVRYFTMLKRGSMPRESGSWTSGGMKNSGTPKL